MANIQITASNTPSPTKIFLYRAFTFPGGETQVRLADNDIKNPTDIEIKFIFREVSDIIELLLVTDALRNEYPYSKLHLVCPYLPFARQDRVCAPGEAFALKMMGDLINMQNYETVTVWDVHSPIADVGAGTWYGINHLRNVTVAEKITAAVIGDSVLVSPDKGAFDRVWYTSKKFNRPMIVAEKIRNPDDGKITGTKICDEDQARINNGEIDCNVGFLIVDDICDGGRTFIELAKVLRPMTTGKIRLYVTHGIFSQGFAVFEGLVDEIITPNCFRDLDNETLQRAGYDLAQLNLTITLV